MSVVILSTGYYPDPDIGKPIANGYIYVGDVDTDPTVTANQKTLSVLQEDGSEVAVAQPIRTSAGGVPVYNGSPVTLIAASPYSLLVQDSAQAQKIYSPSNTGSSQANEDWSEEGAAVAFDSASTFIVDGDVTSTYAAHRAVQLTQTADDTGFVVSSVYAGGPDETTVTVRVATVDSGLTKVEYGIEVAASPGGSDDPFHADTVGEHTGDVVSDTISEETADAGVTVDGVTLKDGGLEDGTTATTQSADDNSTLLATTAYVDTQVAAHGVVQQVYNQSVAVASGGTAIPSDDVAPPQSDEGHEFLTQAITPTNTNNILKIDVTLNLSTAGGAGKRVTTALFQDETADSIAVFSNFHDGADVIYLTRGTFYMVAGTTSSTTFKVRVGDPVGSVITLNGEATARLYGGAMVSSLEITEIKV